MIVILKPFMGNRRNILGELHLWNEVHIYQVKYYLITPFVSWPTETIPGI